MNAPNNYGWPPPQGAPPQNPNPYGYPQGPPGGPPPNYGQPQGPPQNYGAPPGGAPPQGYGYPQGPPQGAPPWGGQPQGGFGGGFDPFAKLGTLSAASSLPFFGTGDGRVIVELVKIVPAKAGEIFFAGEVYVLGYSNPQNSAGSRACFLPKLSGQYADSGLQDAIAFCAACLGMQPSDPRAKFLGGNSPEEAKATMLRIVGPEQPFRGTVVDLSVFAKPKKTKPGEFFSKHTWRPVLDANGAPARMAIPAGVQGPSVGAPAPQGQGYPPGYQNPPQGPGAPQGYGQPQGAPSPAPVSFGFGGANPSNVSPSGNYAPPGAAPPAAPAGPPAGWYDFQPPDPRAGRELWNAQGQTRPK